MPEINSESTINPTKKWTPSPLEIKIRQEQSKISIANTPPETQPAYSPKMSAPPEDNNNPIIASASPEKSQILTPELYTHPEIPHK